MDPLSDVLSLLKPRSYVSSGFDAGGDWSVRFLDQEGWIKCYAVVSGGCWLCVDGESDPVWLKAGDCFALPSGRPFRLASDLSVAPIDSGTVFPPRRAGGIVTLNSGGDVFLVGSRFSVSGRQAGELLRTLPAMVHIQKKKDRAALRWCVEQMMYELGEPQPGGVLIAQHLAHILLVEALRVHLYTTNGGVGWFFALADKQLSVALGAIHGDPAYRWTLESLAKRASMSRSTFAARFKRTVGETPMEYVARWRMLLAADRLETSSDPVSQIAVSLGYESESAFSTAFKRVMGCSPRKHAQGRRSGARSITHSLAAPQERVGITG